MQSASTFGRRQNGAPPQARPLAPRPTAQPRALAVSLDKPDDEAEGFSERAHTWSVPWLSSLILVLLAVVFWVECGGLEGALDLSPSVQRLKAVGALNTVAVLQHGEWWRLLTGPLLHGNVEHIVGNGIVLVLCGAMLEGLTGRAWFAATFVAGGIGGAIASLAMGGPAMTSVGASGAIMALLTATFMCSLHPEAVFNAKRMRWIAVRLALPALIPFSAAGGGNTDYSAHMGGAAAGIAMGFVLQAVWPENRPRPEAKKIGGGIALAGLAAAAAAFLLVSMNFGRWSVPDPRLAPEDAIPEASKDAVQRSAELVLRYPRDPRVRYVHAYAMAELGDWTVVEQDLRAGLAEKQLLEENYSPILPVMMRAMLAVSLVEQRRLEEARQEAAPVCSGVHTDPSVRKLVRMLKQEKICPR